MKSGAIISILVALVALVGLGFIFVQNASPYLTIGELTSQSSGVHVVGQIVPGSLQQSSRSREVRFRLKDPSGEMNVVYNGPTQSNLATATQVVVIGSKRPDHFESNQMLVKCPSKYESDKKAQTQ